MRFYLSVCAFLLTAAPFSLAASRPQRPVPSAAAVAARARQMGAKKAIDGLLQQKQWDAVIDRIAAGSTAWVRIAPLLAPGSDAGSAEDLGIALAFALPKNAAEVLRAIDPENGVVLGVDRVCGVPFIEDTVKDLPAYQRRAARAVEMVRDPRLDRTKAVCLKALRS